MNATEAVCNVVQEEAIAVKNGARKLYKALTGVGACVAIMVIPCFVLTAFKANDSVSVPIVSANEIRQAYVHDIDSEFQVLELLTRTEPLAYGIPAIQENFPTNERRILAEVAHEYGLDKEQTILLFAIRKIENGRPGLEMGVGDGIPNHPARRHAGNFEKSLRLQAEWSSGTLRKRWFGDLHAFANRYCPKRAQLWARNAGRWISTLSVEPSEEPFLLALTFNSK